MCGVSEQPGRYQRSAAGMVGAMLVVVALIFAFVVFRAFNRNDASIEPEKVDYLQTVRGLQSGGAPAVAYPPTLPDGWIATGASFDAAGVWGLSLLTDDDHFVGVRQGQAGQSVDDLVKKYVDDAADEGDPVRLDSPLAGTWRSFTDSGGDYALAADVDGSVVLVVGSAPEDQIQDLTASLTTDPVPSR